MGVHIFLLLINRLVILKYGTLLFNIIVIWVMIIPCLLHYIIIFLKDLLAFLESLKLPILRKFGRDLLQF